MCVYTCVRLASLETLTRRARPVQDDVDDSDPEPEPVAEVDDPVQVRFLAVGFQYSCTFLAWVAAYWNVYGEMPTSGS